MSDRESIKVDSFQISNPVPGQRIEIALDVKPASGKTSSSPSHSSEDWDSIWYLFFLLFSLVFFVGNTVGTGPNPFPDSFYPSSSNSNSFLQPNN